MDFNLRKDAQKAAIEWIDGDWTGVTREGLTEFLLKNFEKRIKDDCREMMEEFHGNSRYLETVLPGHAASLADDVICEISFNFIMDIESLKSEIQSDEGGEFLDRPDLFSTIDSLSRISIALGSPHSKKCYEVKETENE